MTAGFFRRHTPQEAARAGWHAPPRSDALKLTVVDMANDGLLIRETKFTDLAHG